MASNPTGTKLGAASHGQNLSLEVVPFKGAGQYPMLRIPAELEKGHKDRLLPMAFEFAHLLEAVPESERSGLVFQLERNDTLLLR